MISLFFLILGTWIGWWIRGTKAGTWVRKQFSKATDEV